MFIVKTTELFLLTNNGAGYIFYVFLNRLFL